jgi:hypothetical protein
MRDELGRAPVGLTCNIQRLWPRRQFLLIVLAPLALLTPFLAGLFLAAYFC